MNKYDILLYSPSGRSSRTWFGFAIDDDAAIEAAETKNPGYDVHTITTLATGL